MKHIILVLLFLIGISLTGFAESADLKKDFAERVTYRQLEFYDQWEYLTSKELEIGSSLNNEIRLYEDKPTVMNLQRIEDLKMKIIENLQDQIQADRGYITYLEKTLSELSDYRIKPLKFSGEIESVEAIAGDIDNLVETEEFFSTLETAPTVEKEKSTYVKTGDIEEDFARIKETAEKLMKNVEPLRSR